jgi:hypothetical protein
VRKVAPSDMVFVGALVIVAGTCAFIGIATPLGSFANDNFFLLDNAYRVAQGQVPHVDFSSAWGPVIFLIEATGLVLSGMHPSGLGYANAVFGPLFAIWAFLVARNRWNSTVACATGVYTLLLIAAPFVLGVYARDFGYAMIYNRYAYAVLGIVLLDCAGDMLGTKPRGTSGTLLGVSTGAALGVLVFLKASYAIAGLGFIVVLPLAGSAGGLRRLALITGGFSVVTLLALSYLRFDLADMLADLSMAAHSRALALEPSVLRGVVCLENASLAVLAALLWRYRATILVLVTLAVGSAVLVTNQQLGGFPLDAYAALALVGTYAPGAGNVAKWPPAIAVLTALCVVPLCEGSAISLASAALHRPAHAAAAVLEMPERKTSVTFAPVTGKVKSETGGVEYVEDLRDGLELLRKHLDNNEGVLTLDQFNPFNYILNRPSPTGGFAAAAYDYIFDNAYHPTAERFFGSTSYVLVPKYRKPTSDRYEEDGDTLALLRIYGPALRARFRVIAKTKHWVLWRRKTTE